MRGMLVGDDTLQFLVMLDGDAPRNVILDSILRSFPDAAPRKENSCDLRGNWIEIWANEDANEDLVDDPQTGYLHYPWRVEVTPMDPVSEEEQVQLARDLVACFQQIGIGPVVCANFEDRV